MDLYRVLADVRAQYAIPILLVTHDRDEAFRLGERMSVYRQGRIVQSGAAEQIFACPADRGVAAALGYSNVFEAVVERLDPAGGTSRVRAGNVVLTLPYLPGRLLGDHVALCIPPHRVKIGSGENQLDAEVCGESRLPSTVRLTLRAGGLGEVECEISRDAYDGLHLSPSRNVTLALPRAAIHVFQEVQ